MLPMASAANPMEQASATGLTSLNPAFFPVHEPASSSLTERSRSQNASVTQQSNPNQASMTGPSKYEEDSVAFLPAQRRAPTHAMSELEQQGCAAVNSPGGQASAARQAANHEEMAALSAQHPSCVHRSQHTLSEQEQQGSLTEAQVSVAQPLLQGPSPQELELVASHPATGRVSPTRDSPTRDLTELEQQGSFTLTPDASQSQVGNLGGNEAAELARDLARRKGAQAELERQYSELQLQHQQVLSHS